MLFQKQMLNQETYVPIEALIGGPRHMEQTLIRGICILFECCAAVL